jgi:UDP-glucose 6-dehydrogenase
MRISIFGLGYVGAVSLACLARDGHQVIGVDVSQDQLDLISTGRSPVIEEGIQELMPKAVYSGRVEVTKAPKYWDLQFCPEPHVSEESPAALWCTQWLGPMLVRFFP